MFVNLLFLQILELKVPPDEFYLSLFNSDTAHPPSNISKPSVAANIPGML